MESRSRADTGSSLYGRETLSIKDTNQRISYKSQNSTSSDENKENAQSSKTTEKFNKELLTRDYTSNEKNEYGQLLPDENQKKSHETNSTEEKSINSTESSDDLNESANDKKSFIIVDIEDKTTNSAHTITSTDGENTYSNDKITEIAEKNLESENHMTPLYSKKIHNDTDHKNNEKELNEKNENPPLYVEVKSKNKSDEQELEPIILEKKKDSQTADLIIDSHYPSNRNGVLYEYEVNHFIYKNRRFIQYATIGFIVAIALGILTASFYLTFTSPRINKNLNSICESGFCYFLKVKDFQKSADSESQYGDFKGLADSLNYLQTYKVDTIIITDLDQFDDLINAEELSEDIVDCIDLGFYLGITIYVTVKDFSDQNYITNILKYKFMGLVQTSENFDQTEITQANKLIINRTLPRVPKMGYMPSSVDKLVGIDPAENIEKFDFLFLPKLATFNQIGLDLDILENFDIGWLPEMKTPNKDADKSEWETVYKYNGVSIFSLGLLPDYVAFYAGQEFLQPLQANFEELYMSKIGEGDNTYEMLQKNVEYRTYDEFLKCRLPFTDQTKIGPESECFLDQVVILNDDDDCKDMKYSKIITIHNPTDKIVQNLDLGVSIQDEAGNDLKVRFYIDYPLTIYSSSSVDIDLHKFSLEPFHGISILVYRPDES